MDTSTHRLPEKRRETQPVALRHPDHPDKSPRVLCYLGPNLTTGKSAARLRELVSESGLPSQIVSYTKVRRQTEKELSLALQHLAPSPHAFLDLHGDQVAKHAVDAGIVQKEGIFTADLMAWMTARMPRGGADLPVFHVLSCKSGALAKDIVPGSDRWHSAYVIAYAGHQQISLGHVDCALTTAMRYLNHCQQQGRRVDPFKVFLLAGMRRGDCMTLMGGDLKAPVRWHGPKTGKDLTETRRLADMMEGHPSDIERLARVAGSIPPDEEALLPQVEDALKDIFRARLLRADLSHLSELVRQQPTLVNDLDCTGYPPLHDAVDDKRPTLVNFLLKNGAAIDNKDHLGETPLLHVVTTVTEPDEREAMMPMLEHLLTCGANPNACTSDGLSALSVAVDLGWTEAVQLLLTHNADPNAKHGEISPLTVAREKGDQEMITLLEQAGAREKDS
jgi:hypothetical protein